MADVGEIRARLVLSSDQFNRGMQSARNQMDATNRSAQRTSKAIDKIHHASLGFATAVGAVFAASIGTAANFEQKMKDVQAVSGESADNMQKLTDLAMEMGKKTSFSSAEAAEGIEELVKAGVSVTEILDGGLEGALNLAVAGSLNLADAAEIASTALNAFKDDNLSVAQAADILAGAANASATDVSQMKFGLSMVSAVASGVGLSFKDTSTALALFAQNGLKGSDAGTSLKTMLLNLSPHTKAAADQMEALNLGTANAGAAYKWLVEKGMKPASNSVDDVAKALMKLAKQEAGAKASASKISKEYDKLAKYSGFASSAFYDANGNLKSMSEIAGTLQNALKNLNSEQRQQALNTMFGTDAIRAANILYKEGAKGIDDMWTAMSKVTAADVAKVKLDSLKGAFTELTSALESVGIKIGLQFLPALTQITRTANEFVGSLSDVNIANIESALAFAGTAAAVAFLGTTFVKLAGSLRLVFTAMGPAGWIITGLSLIGGAIAATAIRQDDLNEATLAHLEARIKEQDALDATISQYDALKSKSKLTNDEFARFVDINTELSKTADVDTIARLRDEQDKLAQKSGLSNDELNKMVGLNDDLIKKVPEATKTITDQGNAILESTNKLKQYSAAKLSSLYNDLNLENIKNQTAYNNLMKEENALVQQRHSQEEKLQALIAQRDEAQVKANSEQAMLNRMMADTEKYSQAAVDAQVQKNAAAQSELTALQSKLEKQAASIQQNETDLDKTRSKIQKLEEVKNKMAQIIVTQAGLNAKVGEELSVINSAIGRLEAQKQKLLDTTPAAQRNTAEFRNAVSAIDAQIGRLQSAKSQVEQITGKAIAMNAELGKSIHKTIIQEMVQTGSGWMQQKLNPDYQRHNGGPFPKLHVGGNASQFASTPNHNEVDVRLLRNEMVLTEAQQSNLFRMLDAGMTGGTKDSAPSALKQSITNYITVEGNIDTDLYNDIMRKQNDEYDTQIRLTGVKNR